jgi:CRP-like cAMP-binding protein
MINGSENNNGFARKDVSLGWRSRETTSIASVRVEEIRNLKRESQAIKPVPFNGLLTNKILTELPGEEFARLLPHLEPVSLTCGEDLYGFGEGISYIYFPETSVISHLHVLEDGSTTEGAMIGKEGLTGLSAIFGALPAIYWTQVTISGTALRISAEVLKQEFHRGGVLQRLLLSYTSTRMAQLSQRAVCNGRHTVAERLSSWLLMIHDRVGDNQIPLTHEQIAHHLGTRRAGITNAATALRDARIIGYSRGQIDILNRQALEDTACECYRALSQKTQQTSLL